MLTTVHANSELRYRTAVLDRETCGTDELTKQKLWLEMIKREKRDISQDPGYTPDRVVVVDLDFGQEFTVAGYFAIVRRERESGVIRLN